MKIRCAAAFLLALVSGLQAEDAAVTADQQARLVAGLEVPGAAFEKVCKQPAWIQHSKEFNAAWERLEQKQLAKIREWSPNVLGNDATSRDPLFYFFSGPDFLYANTFFPNASVYVFCGLEPVGAPPDVLNLSPGALSGSLANLRKSLNALLSFSFFITKEMKGDLRATQLNGTLPVMYLFMARLGNTIQKVEPVTLDENGEVQPAQAGAPGVRIVFGRDHQPAQTLYYFSTDLSNNGIKTKPSFIKFCGKLGPGNGFAKAASYLMHMDEFSDARNFLLSHCKMIVQDDSGIPFRYFAQDAWDVLCVGRYPGPIPLFSNRYQKDLAVAVKASNSPALTFSFGYRWHPSESSVIIATALQYVPKAVPVK